MGKAADKDRQAPAWIGPTVLLGVLLLLFSLARAGQTESGLAANELQLINEAVVFMRTHSLIPPRSTGRMTEEIIRAYAHVIDDYTDYLTREEYAGFRESANSDYFGVEMDLQKREDHISLFPFKGGQAEQKGIRAGDELLAVNGAPVFGKSVFLIGTLIRGAEGTTVQLTTRSGSGIPRVVTLRRERTRFKPVTRVAAGDVPLIEISRFADNTAAVLKEILAGIAGEPGKIIIDLRRNQGGNLQEAILAADLFVEPGTVLLKLRSRTGTREIVAEAPALTAAEVVLIQDRTTASAAEAFIAALTRNHRAVSVGEKSFGKGLAQRFLELSDGSALVLTYAEILGPDGATINEKGLEPDIVLPPELVQEEFRSNESMHKLLELTETVQP